MKQFENGQKVIVNRYGAEVEYTYIGRMPEDWNEKPHCVQSNTHGFFAVEDEFIRPAPVRKEGWVNLWRKTNGLFSSTSAPYPSEMAAQRAARLNYGEGEFDTGYAGTVRVTWEE